MITFPTTLTQAAAALSEQDSELRAGATDLQERRHQHISAGPLVDLRDLPGLDTITETADGGLRIGALVPIQQLADDDRVRRGYPGLAAAAGGLATPQVRARGTVGGNVLQKVRCWYYRNPVFTCLRNDSASPCLARAGDHQLHAAIDQGPCVCVHPSTLATAFIAWDAVAEVHGGEERAVADIAAKNTNPTLDRHLEAGEILTAIRLPPPVPGEFSAYKRAISRARAEWPLVEVVVVVAPDEATARGVLGGVANQPIAIGGFPESMADEVVAEANPLPMTGYKLDMIPALVADAVTLAVEGPGAEALELPETDETDATDDEGGE